MPNWCFNSIKITGPEEDLKKFKKIAETPRKMKEWVETKINTFALLGVPENDDVKNVPDWFFWGELEWSKDKKGNPFLVGSYDTRWDNKDGTLCSISAKFPTLSFINRYEEPNMCFKGSGRFKGGNMTKRTYSETN